MLVINTLSLSYGAGKKLGSAPMALHKVSLTIPRESVTFLVGPSGTGKTSVLRCIATLENNYQGAILLDGKKVKELTPQERARRIGMVFQAYNLFPHLTALQNCSLALIQTFGMEQKQAHEQSLKKLELLGIEHLTNRYPHQLSGGQQQRVALARALVLEPEILLLDEPTAALDPFNTANLQRIITSLKESGITIVISTHDTEFVKGIFERSYLFDNGSIAECIETRDYLIPSTKTAHFLGFSF